MFNIGGGELIVILLIALIVLGPQRLPDAARQIGKTMGELRRLSSGFQNEMKQALETADDPTRIAARRNVLARDTPPDPAAAEVADGVEPEAAVPEPVPVEIVEPAEPPEVTHAAAESIAAVTGQPSAPPKRTPPAAEARAAAKKEAPSDVPESPSPRTTT